MGAECPRSGGPGNRTPVGAAYCVTGTVALSDRVIIRQENLSSAPAPGQPDRRSGPFRARVTAAE